jgi:hypothetical protein
MLILMQFIFICRGNVLALDCPKMPEQSKKDWEVEVNAAVLKIGPVKGGELKTRTSNVTKDLISKLPQAGRIYLEQMMYSSYCSALRDDKNISESEKAQRVREYNRELRITLSSFSATQRKRSTRIPPKQSNNRPIEMFIEGTVLDKDKLPIEGAIVTTNKTFKAYTTDASGNYKLPVNATMNESIAVTVKKYGYKTDIKYQYVGNDVQIYLRRE